MMAPCFTHTLCLLRCVLIGCHHTSQAPDAGKAFLKRHTTLGFRYLICSWQSTEAQQGEGIMDLFCYPVITEVIPDLELWHLKEY
jgi:hypothetical protein